MRIPVFALLGLGLLTACEYTGAAEGPVARNLKWFSYVGGEDIRKACGPGAPDRYRFVYNGIYDKQIRTYDIHMLPERKGASLSAWARSEPNLAQSLTASEIGSLWDGMRAQTTLNVQGLGELKQALEADRLGTDRPPTLRLPSDEFYWTAAVCRNGRFITNAWLYPTDRFASLEFPGVLMHYDRTGEPFYGPRPVSQRDDDPGMDGSDENSREFFIQLGPDGFVGTDGLL